MSAEGIWMWTDPYIKLPVRSNLSPLTRKRDVRVFKVSNLYLQQADSVFGFAPLIVQVGPKIQKGGVFSSCCGSEVITSIATS